MPLRKFELLSLVGRKKSEEGSAAPPPLHHRSTSSSSVSNRPPYPPPSGAFHSGFARSSSSSSSAPPPLPPPAPSVPVRDGFYSAVQYERLTPSVNQAPAVLGGSSASYGNQSTASSSVQYERLVSSSSSARLPSPPVHYERLQPPSSSVRLPSPQYERLTPTASPAGGATLHRSPMPYRQHSPLQYDSGGASGGVSPSLAQIPPLRSASFPSPNLPSPTVLRSPVELSSSAPPPRVDSLRHNRKPPLPPVAENSPTDVPMSDDNGTPSDKSTPFSLVMEEWMAQLRTPTPDVMLLPSPYDFHKDAPTPPTADRMEDIRQMIHDALLPTPPQMVGADQRQGTKTNEYVTSSNARRPLVDDIASLCRDLITQEVSEQLAKRLIKMGAFSASNLKQQQQQAKTKTNEPANDDDGEDDEDQANDDASSAAGGNPKGKRRKMCTAEGCQNLSRSRGLCKAHGGGRRCSVEGCSRASQSGSLCITHGGGKRCTVDGCMKAAQSRGMCKAHGGGVRCRVEGCTKSSQGDGFCRTHGGGRRCGFEGGCQKWAQRNGMCMAHSEGRYGNSYRGRVARNGDADQQIAAQALVGAAHAPVY